MSRRIDYAEERKHLSLLQRLQLALLWGFCRLLSWTPHWFRYYVLQEFLFLIFRLIRYRRRVILENLENSFPEKSPRELRRILRRYYQTLAEVVVGTISVAGVTPKRAKRWVEWPTAEEHIRQLNGRDWIAMASHFGCWEFFLLWCFVDPDQRMMGVYHHLHNPVFAYFYRRLRALSPLIDQVDMHDTARFYLRQQRGPRAKIAMGLIADQNPPRLPGAYWFYFLNQPTLFFEGAEKLAVRFHIPAYFCHIERIHRGRYRIWFEEIYDGTSPVEEHEVTRRYAHCLEQMIRRTPELWTWSHRRWKHKPNPEEDWKTERNRVEERWGRENAEVR